MADNAALSSLRADALLYVGVIGGVLTASLGIATSTDGLTAMQSVTALTAYLMLGFAAVGGLAAHLPQQRFGAANALTLARGAIVATLAGFLSGPIDTRLSWIAALLAFAAIALDGVDGWLARRLRMVSSFGARFDMEVDALLMLVLGLLLLTSGTVGAWVLLIGAARYLFVAAGRMVPALRAPLPYSERRRAVCVFQGLALVVALVPILPPFVAALAAAAGLGATAWSFGIDILHLLQVQAASRQNGAGMRRLLARSWGLCRSVLIYHAIPFRQSRLRALLLPLVPPDGLAFDLGAHVGNRARALRGLGARVIAIEPQPVYASLLRQLFARDEKTVIVEAAIGDRAGNAVLLVSDRHPTVSTLSRAWRDRVGRHPSFLEVSWNREIQVKVETLDALIERFGKPDFIKLDIEGSEASALRGLSCPIKALSFEYVPGALSDAAACIDLLERLGRYRYNWSAGETMRFAFPEWLDAAGIRAFIAGPQAGDRSGDIYCRLAS